MITKEKDRVKAAISSNQKEASGTTRWNQSCSKQIVPMITGFNNELLFMVESIADESKVRILEYFSNVSLLIAATTRDYEPLNEHEMDAFKSLMEDVKALCEEVLNEGFTDEMFCKANYVREIIRVNAVYREDYDCKYRMGMIFPYHEDMVAIVHRIITDWNEMELCEGFKTQFYRFNRSWQKSNTNEFDTSNGRTRANEFMALLDKFVSKSN